MAKNTLSRESLIYFIARRAKISYAQATLALDRLTQVLTSTLKTGESIELVGFGKFEIRNSCSCCKNYNHSYHDKNHSGASQKSSCVHPGKKTKSCYLPKRLVVAKTQLVSVKSKIQLLLTFTEPSYFIQNDVENGRENARGTPVPVVYSLSLSLFLRLFFYHLINKAVDN
jgi:hypothetical protein